ncbi:MAG TPA: tail fiber domain-containing protein [Verrucomicrobiae bacterium]|nr:tail fiber domain-containing protein [Verrucomicrobiae bacterium]
MKTPQNRFVSSPRSSRSIAIQFGRLLLATLSLLMSAAVHAEPPEFMTYQGFLVDGNGNPLATNAPANYPVIFRVYDSQSGGTVLWAEQQIVTVDKGNFSAMLGEGTPVSGVNPVTLSSLFSGPTSAQRYLSLSVTIGSSQPLEMLPRLRLLPAPYAYQATSAINLVGPSGAPVIRYANGRAEVTGDFYASGVLNGNGAGLTGLSASQIGSGSFPDARLSGNVALRGGGNAFTGDQTIAGNVGIGGAPVDAALDVEGNMRLNTADLWLREGGDRNHGLGWYGLGKPFAGLAVDGPVLYGWSGGGLATRSTGDKFALTWDIAGRIGIGNTSPFRLLEVGSTAVPNSEGMIRLGSRSGTGGANRIWDIGVPETDETVTGSSYSFIIDDIQAGGTEFMVKAGTGNVGIGTTDPAEKLDVNGNARVNGGVRAVGGVIVGASDARVTYGEATPGALEIIGGGATATRKVKIWSEGGASIAGRLGIGIDAPGVPLDVGAGPTVLMTANRYNSNDDNLGPSNIRALIPAGGGGTTWDYPNALTRRISIRAAHWIVSAQGVASYSDRRIKQDIEASSTAKDLAAVQQLRVADYQMIDSAAGGPAWHKGFIAQEVEKVIPGAVGLGVEFVPDIFALATNVVFHSDAKTLSVSLPKAHGLKAGDRVRLHVDGTRLDANVSDVPSSYEFVVEKCERAPEKVFVYGRQVNDFRTVDYDRIFTTGIGAIQELANKVQALESSAATAAERHKQELESLRRQVAQLQDHAVRADALQAELDEVKKVVGKLVTARSQADSAAVVTEPPSVASTSQTATGKSIAAR